MKGERRRGEEGKGEGRMFMVHGSWFERRTMYEEQ
jgi:hypothetical protein